MHISAQFGAEDAVTEDEKSRVHTSGSDTGTFYTSFFTQVSPIRNEDGSMDFSAAYCEALAQFMKEEPRAAEGKAFRISIIA